MAYPDLSFSLVPSGARRRDSQHRFATESPPEDHGADIAAKDHLDHYADRRLAMHSKVPPETAAESSPRAHSSTSPSAGLAASHSCCDLSGHSEDHGPRSAGDASQPRMGLFGRSSPGRGWTCDDDSCAGGS